MNGFLAQVAQDLYGRYGNEVSSLSVLFPSRRAGLFFGEALSEIITRPLWQPSAVTIDGLMEELSGLSVGERLRLVVELYRIYADYHPSETFDGFYFWGELLLGDFDGIDKYLIDADVLFSNLVDLHELDYRFDYLSPEQRAVVEKFWGTFRRASGAHPGGEMNPHNNQGSEGGFSAEQADFLRVWRTLAPIYHRFRARLRELGIAYPGMVYREAAERILEGRAPQIPTRRYVIAGFNALSRCEQVLFDWLQKNFQVDFYWDYDEYFVSDEIQEAGRFMRDNLKRFPQSSPLSGGHNNFLKPKDIRSVSAASDVLQCKYAGLRVAELLDQNPETDAVRAETMSAAGTGAGASKTEENRRLKNTAIVLCDETLLTPLLWSMPPTVDKINVTMGYPLRAHPTYSFVERLIELQNRRKSSRNSLVFYHSDVEGLMRNPYVLAAQDAARKSGNDGTLNAALKSASDAAPEASQNAARKTEDRPVFRSQYIYLNAAKLSTTPLLKRIFVAPGSANDHEDRNVNADSARPETLSGDTGNSGKAGCGSDAEHSTDNWRAMSDWLIGIISEVAQSSSKTDTQFFAIIVDHIRALAASLETVTRAAYGPDGGFRHEDPLRDREGGEPGQKSHNSGPGSKGDEIDISPKTYAALLRRSLQSVTVPFEGEPLEGVQVMGILETRALDFENVIFLSAGDSNAPGNLSGAPSFIPYNLKMAYGLPTPEHHEGVWAYHFFRLVQRARLVDLVWSQTADDRSTGQPSRYIWQLDYESPHEVEKRSVTVDVNLSPPIPIAVEKEVEKIPRTLSPSTFYSYVECPLKFYFRTVARLRVDDEVTEEIDNALFGNILHLAMQRLYSPLVGVADPRPQIRALIGSAAVERAIEDAIGELDTRQEGAQREDWGGGMMLIHKTIADYINRAILHWDAALKTGFTIAALEKEIETDFDFVVGGGPGNDSRNGQGDDLRDGGGSFGGEARGEDRRRSNPGNGRADEKITFRGIADRIDVLSDNALRIVDYKTGSPKNRESAVMQMRLYAMMLAGGKNVGGNGTGNRTVETALYYIRDMSRPDYEPPKIDLASGGKDRVIDRDRTSGPGYNEENRSKNSPGITDAYGGGFEEELREILGEMFDPAVPFAQCEDPAPCAWCDFREICRR